jgi:probable O-glycosylation ligase (exosortase A-associated)
MTSPIMRRGRVRPVAPAAPAGSETVPRDRPLLAGREWTPAYAAVLLYIFNIVTYRLPVGTGTVAMSIALLTLPMEHRPLRLPPVVAWTMALLGWAVLGWTTSIYPDFVWDHLIEFAKIVGVILVAVNVLTTRARMRFFLLAFLGYFAFYPVRGALITYFSYGGGPGGRAAWNYAYENPNDLAGMCLLVFSLAVGMLITDRRLWIRACALAGTVVLPLVILLTQSRGAFIAMLAIVAIALKGVWRRGKTLIWGAVALAALAFVTPDSVWRRLGTLKDVTNEQAAVQANDEGSARQRLEIWKVATTIFTENPILGVGLGAYSKAHYVTSQRPVFDPTALGARDTHSTYLNLLAETGLPGLLLFLTVIFSTVFDAERTRRRARIRNPAGAMQLYYMELGLLGYLVAGIWGTYGQLVLTYLHIAIIFAATQILKEERPPVALAVPRRGLQPAPRSMPAAVRGRGR